MGAADLEMIAQSRVGTPKARVIGALMLAITMAIGVLVLSEERPESVLESAVTAPAFPQDSLRLQISQQMNKYDEAIKRVDEGIAHAKLDLVANSHKLSRATQLAVTLHAKLVRDHQALLAEAARSRAMKQLRAKLATKEGLVAAERKKLQTDALGLAAIEQRARGLLSPAYVPNAQELQAVAQEANISPPPALSLMQKEHA